MLSAGRGLQLGQTHGGTHTIPWTSTFISGKEGWFLFISLFIFISLPQARTWPYDYRHLYNHCPGPEWNVMCRGCCEYDVIRCKCPLQGTPVGYAVPCCRNAINECDPCIIHPGCSVFENCKRCNNGTWGPRDDFFISGKYCAECRPGWSGGDCMKCGGVIRKRQGHLVLESYPNNARCEWTIQVDRPFTIELRFMMLSLELHHSCRYDYVEVRDGDSINSGVIGRFCGNNRPAPIQSSGNSLHILFVSDGYKNFDGFFATFQESSACSSSPCLHDGTCILDSSYTYHCACLAGYTGKRCENVLGCRRPPVPSHGFTEGLFHHSGARITFRCDLGFELRGFRSAICLSDGTWSAPAPECVPVERVCALPPKPTHGDHFLVYGPNDVLIALQYLCYQPYELSGTSQRTCLPNNTWSGTPPVCTKVNNTLTEAEKDKDKAKESEKGKEIEIYSDKDINKAKEKSQENTTGEKESTRGEDINTGHENTTAVDREDKYTGTIPEKPVAEDRNEGVLEERNTASEKPTGSSKDKVDSKDPDNSLNTVEKKEPEAALPPEKKEGSPDINLGTGKTDITEIVVIKDKGQEEKERKEEQVNGKRDPDKVGPNDTKLRTVISEGENTVEIFELEMTKNNTVTYDTKDTKTENNTIGTPENGRKIIPTRVNITQYRAGGEDDGKPKEKATTEEDKTEKDPAEKTKEELDREKEEKEKEKEKEVNQSFTEKSCPPLPRLYHGYHQVVPRLDPETVEFLCNHSYALSGDTRRTCQPDGTWSGKQPLCIRACREPKVSELVIQRVLPPQTPSRKTPVHKFYSSVLGRQLQSEGPTKGPPVLPQLSQGFHHLYTHIQYECASPFYQHSGSPRRTCLKTGKWSGRHVSCSPVCGKHPTFDPERPGEAHWPWLAAIYRRSTNGMETKVTKADSLAGSLKKDGGAGTGNHNRASDWQLVCSGALVNQRSVVVAAHCVTELGKVYPLDAAKIKVVVGKHYRDDLRESKGLQHLRVASIVVHPNYDPNILDSDMAVVKLLDKARIGEKVLPLCFSESPAEEVTYRQGLVTGWSPLPDSSLGADERVRVGVVHLADVVPCEQQYARNGVPVSVTDNMLCASQKPDYGSSNICPSDTGGILVLPALSDNQASNNQKPSLSFTQAQGESKGLWRLLGLVSFGYDQGECNPDLYTVYTRVANFRDWVENNMK
ncbi:inactive serine protease PAMR1 isoform X1 [Seriola aureovittata]|uniref:inactive serine protease PAMR1 isoform X1 n=1 Tax=Seriola aureovittata TaxID=2871759 RepID=UPI0024BE8A57|nr:inactive serine protease PAMR1 isoform X1 [Seriola aureovittata]